jgi:hypothetical protein
MGRIFNILTLVLLMCGFIAGQTKTNIEMFYGLVEKSVAAVVPVKAKKESRVYVEYSSPENFLLLKGSLIEKTGAAAKVSPKKEDSDYIFTYTVEEAKVKYGESFTKSFLGRSYVEREVSLKGFAGINKPNENVTTGRFAYSEKDTVEYSTLKELGNPAYPFASPEIPPESFFSSIWEPAIAIGVAVTTIYLLFTVRSK